MLPDTPLFGSIDPLSSKTDARGMIACVNWVTAVSKLFELVLQGRWLRPKQTGLCLQAGSDSNLSEERIRNGITIVTF
jgi:hypothetical protein